MPWQERTVEHQRQSFVLAAQQGDVPMAELCRQHGISRKTGYKWVTRAAAGEDLADRSRRPHRSPGQTSPAIEAQVLALRDAQPTWGSRKLHHRLVALGVAEVPAPSTITGILRRHGQLAPEPPRRDFQRFEHPAPNILWQMDFKGHWALLGGGRVFPWDLLDDHSRYALALRACENQQRQTVQDQLTTVFQAYGLPDAILCDNGSPWGPAGMGGLTTCEVWLLQLGVEPIHGQPFHPQTQGKIERFHGTLARDVAARPPLRTLAEAQAAFDRFRTVYNHERPHEALGYATPASCYQPSARPFPQALPAVIYDTGVLVRTVTVHGSISWQGGRHFIGRGLVGQPVALEPTDDPAVWRVIFGTRQVAVIDLRTPDEV